MQTTKMEDFLLGNRAGYEPSQPGTEGNDPWDETMDALVGSVEIDLAFMLARVARRWKHTRNPYFLDFALLLCEENNVQIPPAIMSGLATVAHQRLMGTDLGGTAAQVRKELLLERTYQLIAEFRVAGLTLERAVSKASGELHAISDITLKAATIERLYKKSLWPALEAILSEQSEGDNRKVHWQKIAEALPDADEEIRGTRR